MNLEKEAYEGETFEEAIRNHIDGFDSILDADSHAGDELDGASYEIIEIRIKRV